MLTKKKTRHSEVFLEENSNPQFNISAIQTFKKRLLHLHLLCRHSLISFVLKFRDAYIEIMVEERYHCEKSLPSEDEWLPYINTNRMRMVYTIWLQLLLITLNIDFWKKKSTYRIFPILKNFNNKIIYGGKTVDNKNDITTLMKCGDKERCST